MNTSPDIRTWLESVGLGELSPAFEANALGFDVLPQLTPGHLNQMGIPHEYHERFFAAVAALSDPANGGQQLVMLTPSAATAPSTRAEHAAAVMEQRDKQLAKAAHAAAKPKSRGGVFSGRFMIISICFHLILAVLAGYWVVQKIEVKRKLQFTNGPPTTDPSKRALEHKVSLQQKKNAGGSPAQAQRIAVAGLASKITLPDMPQVATTSTQFVAGRMAGMGGAGMGTGMGFGNGSGNGIGGTGGGTGKLFALIPQAMSKRCSKADRLQRLKDNGGTPACEDAVIKALKWLKANQNQDGSWGQSHRVAMTGLALMAYFGHCETPVSPEFGETCVKGITFLVSEGMRSDGKLGGDQSSQSFCYEHPIGTYALAEATTFCKEIKYNIPNLREVTAKAGQYIIDNQNSNGGWAYNYAKSGGHTDVSVVGWQMQSLKACSHTGIEYQGLGECISRGLEYLATCQGESGAFGYTGPPGGNGHQSLTGVGMLCYQMWGQGKGSIVRKAARQTLDTTTFDFKQNADLYAHYYESQAMMQRGSSEWRRYNEMFRDQLLNNQKPDGSWDVPPGSKHVTDNLFGTCLCTLMLEVYYRFLTTGGATGGRGRLGY